MKSSDAEPYAQAEAAVRDALAREAPGPAGRKHEVRSVSAKEVTEKGVVATIGQPDAVVAIGTPAARWLHQQLPGNVRLVYCMVNNAAEAGLLQGQDCTGVVTEIPPAEQLKLLSDALPRARTVGTLYRSDTPEGKASAQVLRDALPAGWRVEAVAVNDFPAVAGAIDPPDAQERGRGLDVGGAEAVRHRHRAGPAAGGAAEQDSRLGLLPGVRPRRRPDRRRRRAAAQGTQAAELVGKLLAAPAGADGDRIRPPREFQVAVNLIVAKQLGVDVPEPAVRRATIVYRPEN